MQHLAALLTTKQSMPALPVENNPITTGSFRFCHNNEVSDFVMCHAIDAWAIPSMHQFFGPAPRAGLSCEVDIAADRMQPCDDLLGCDVLCTADVGVKQTKLCSVLKSHLPLADFPSKGNMSIKAECAVEALQKRLKAAWKDEYSVRYKALKKDGEKWRDSVMAIVAANETEGNGRGASKTIPAQIWNLVTENFSTDQTTDRAIEEPMTWPVFEKFRESPEGGGYGKEAILQEWTEMATNGTESDKKGVVSGQPGHLRYYVKKGDQRLIDKTTGKRREASQAAGGRKEKVRQYGELRRGRDEF